MSYMYGYPATLTAITIDGLAPDGTARPSADIHAIVEFDSVQAGCQSNGFCNPGADIEWWVNDVKIEQSVGSGYNELLKGYRVASPRLTAPRSGTISIVAKNSDSTAPFPTITVSGTDTSAGQVNITEVRCGNQENNRTAERLGCGCDQYGMVLYCVTNVSNVGNGMAYYDVLVNGVVASENNVASTRAGNETVNSVTISCPRVGDVVTVRGKNDNGARVVVATTTVGGGGTGGDEDRCPYMGCQYGCTNNTCTPAPYSGCTFGTCPNGQVCSNGICVPNAVQTSCIGMERNGSIDPTCALQSGNEMYLVGGLAATAIIAFILLKKKK